MKIGAEQILDEAINKLKSGKSVEAVLLEMSEYREELTPLLDVAKFGLHIALKPVPSADRQRRFLTVERKPNWIIKYLSIIKLSFVPIGALFLAITAMTAAANPGQPFLYKVKTAIQRAPLVFLSEDGRAEKELALSEKALSDTERFLASQNENAELNAVVASELARQTSKMVTSVQNLASANAINQNPAMLNKLVAITEKQDKLVSSIQSSVAAGIAHSVLEATKQETTQTIAKVQKLVASVNEHTMVNLPAADEKEETLRANASGGNRDQKDENITKTSLKPTAKTMPLSTSAHEAPVAEIENVSVETAQLPIDDSNTVTARVKIESAAGSNLTEPK